MRRVYFSNLSTEVVDDAGVGERVEDAERHSLVGGATSGRVVVVAVDGEHWNGDVEMRVVIIRPRKPAVSLEVHRQIAHDVKGHFLVAERVLPKQLDGSSWEKLEEVA